MNTVLRSLGGAAFAAAAMYWFDPASGRRRRARLRDKLISASGDLRTAIDIGGRDLAHRIQGTVAVTRSAYNGRRVNDGVLTERVRSILGRVVSHPRAIVVTVSNGHVMLSGDVLAEEFPQLMRAVRATQGVASVQDKLLIHADSRGISALQGGRPRHPVNFLMRERWSPATRLVGGAAGGMLAAWGLYTRGVLGMAGVAAGGALLARSGANVPLKRWVGITDDRGMVMQVHKTILVNAPVDQVFQTLSVYENYPQFMRNVRSVQLQPDGRTHWCVAGPAGVLLKWESVTTEFEMNRLLAWRTSAAAPIQHAGVMRFEPVNGGGTRVDIQMSYRPPAGVLGHAVAAIFGADPKSELDQELLRLKSFLETGKAPRDAASTASPSRGFVPNGAATGLSRG